MVRRRPASPRSEQRKPNELELGGGEPAVGEGLARAWFSEENAKGDDLDESIAAEELQDLDFAQDAEGALADSEENVKGDDMEEGINADESQRLNNAQDAGGALADVRVFAPVSLA